MKLIHQLCILLLINFATCSSEQEDPCHDEYMKHTACYRKMKNDEDLFLVLNATDGDTDLLRPVINRYCESGFIYLQCIEDIALEAQCQDTEFMPPKIHASQVFFDNVTKFGIEYFCRNEGEAVFKIAANDGLKSTLKPETGETIRRCLSVSKSSDYNTPASELFCRDVDAVSGCLLEYSDKMTNQDISAIIRDIIPQLKVIANCAATA